jgi:hypothetical protein
VDSCGALALGQGLDVKLDWRVTEVHYSCLGDGGSDAGTEPGGGVITIKGLGSHGAVEAVEARRCILAAPITALKRGITFHPPLPTMKTQAINRAGSPPL